MTHSLLRPYGASPQCSTWGPSPCSKSIPEPSAAFSLLSRSHVPCLVLTGLRRLEAFRPREAWDESRWAPRQLATPWIQERRRPGTGLSWLSPQAQHGAQCTSGDHKCVHTSAQILLTEPGALTLPLGEVSFRSGPTPPGNAPASCRAGTWGWRRACRRRAGTQGCHGAFSRRRLPPGKHIRQNRL